MKTTPKKEASMPFPPEKSTWVDGVIALCLGALIVAMYGMLIWGMVRI